MIGVFDSGIGGLCSFERLCELVKDEELVYLADRKHAPYGTKTVEEVASRTRHNVSLLRKIGAEKILIACCTASGTYTLLDPDDRAVAIPIIYPAAKAAINAAGAYGKITVISTALTAKAHLFKHELECLDSTVQITELEAQSLVDLVELGAKDGDLLPRESELIDMLCEQIESGKPNALILGCTHFSHLKEEFSKRLRGINVIDTARLGAEYLAKILKP